MSLQPLSLPDPSDLPESYLPAEQELPRVWKDSDHRAAAKALASATLSDSLLEDLLAESMADSKRHEEVKAGRQLLAKGGLAAADAAAINDSVRAWEAKREWRPQAAVVMFSRQKCQGCGQFHTQFLGFYERQRHRSSNLDRWIKHFRPVNDLLPRESKYQDSYSEVCEDCAEHLGFEVEES